MNQFQISEVSAARSPLRRPVEILVFKTNLTDTKRISDVESVLDAHPHIVEWNVDLDDCDNVLRIVSRNITGQEIENLLLNAGYFCEELQ